MPTNRFRVMGRACIRPNASPPALDRCHISRTRLHRPMSHPGPPHPASTVPSSILARPTPTHTAFQLLPKPHRPCPQISNRELKRKLREATEGVEGDRQQLVAALQQSSAEQRLNEQLQAEIRNLRSYLEVHPGATPTKVNKNVLRQIEVSADPAKPKQAGIVPEARGLPRPADPAATPQAFCAYAQ